MEISLNVSVEIPNGPRVNYADPIAADTYDILDILIPAATPAAPAAPEPGGGEDAEEEEEEEAAAAPTPSTVTARVAPANSAGRLVVIQPSTLHRDLVLENGANDIHLDHPLILVGDAVGALQSIQEMTFRNGTAEAIRVTIIVGRNAVAA
jgi:hypothetical protein